MRVYLLKKVENIVVKGEIARFEQYFLLSQCIQKLSAAEASESAYIWERVKPFPHTTNLLQMTEKYLGKDVEIFLK